MSTRCVVCVSLGILTASSTITHAQGAPGPERVRLSSRGDRRIGTLMSANQDSIVIRDDASRRVATPSFAVTAFERSDGRHGHAGTGAWVGALCGFAVGALVVREQGAGGLAGYDASDAAPLVVGPLIGTGVGALVGTFIRTEQWAPVPRPWRITIDPEGPTRLALSIPLGDPVPPGQ